MTLRFFLKRNPVFSLFSVAILLGTAGAAQAESYAPTSQWLVGPVSAKSDDNPGPIPCIVSNQFSNGYSVRFSGGGGRLLAMAVDFHQQAFTAHQHYDVQFSDPGVFFQTVQGAAFDGGTLVFGLADKPEFYKGVQNAKSLTIKLGDNAVSLQMKGLADGFKRMEACYDPDNGRTKQSVRDQASSSELRQNPMLASGDDAVPALDAAPANAMAEHRIVVGAAPQASGAEVQDLAARAQAAQEAAAMLGGADKPQTSTAASETPAAAKAQPAADLAAGGAQGRNVGSSWSNPKALRADTDVLATATPPSGQKPADTQTMHWRAVKGADLQSVLTTWTDALGVKLIWMAGPGFTVLQPISMTAQFSDAARTLLAEFEGLPVRPVGQIYRDPKSGQLVIVVRQSKAD